MPDGRQGAKILPLHALRCEQAIAELQNAFAAMAENMDRRHIRASGKRLRNLLDAIACGIDHNNFSVVF